MAPIKIATEDKQYARVSLKGHVLVFKRNRYAVCSIPEGQEARQVTHGPMVAGPWVKAFELGSVLSANPEMGTGAEMRRNREAGTEHDVVEGDQVEVDGHIYTVAAGEGFRRDYLRLDFLS